MSQNDMIQKVRAAREALRDEEERLGREVFVQRQRERVVHFLRGTPAEIVPPGLPLTTAANKQ